MDNSEAIAIFEKLHLVHEIQEMNYDIGDIDCILGSQFINMDDVVTKIKKINEKHPENVVINYIIFPPIGGICKVDDAPDLSKINDLIWKRRYLQAKSLGKTFDEFVKELTKENGAN
ncbi:MAG: hypothetical protein K2N90_04055 [Lachnospiraceae bacterium]|nr:hypothetical protein [Lachnospiraceae bacterium]